MTKGNKNNIVYIVISCIVAIVLLALAGVSLYKVINIENDSIPEVISEIDNSKKNTTKLASELQERVNLLDKKIAEEIANLEKVQKDLNSATNKTINENSENILNIVDSHYNSLMELNNKNYNNLKKKINNFNDETRTNFINVNQKIDN